MNRMRPNEFRPSIQGAPPAQRVGEFIELFTRYEGRLRAFAVSMTGNWADAEDVAQQANLTLWAKFDEFEPGSNFFAWASQIVYLKAKDFRRQRARRRARFGEELTDVMAREATAVVEELDDRQRLLGACIEKLSEEHRRILRLRYEEGGSIERMCEALGRSADGVYHALSRIRKALFQCVNRAMGARRPA